MAPLKNGSAQPMGVRVGELITSAACWHASGIGLARRAAGRFSLHEISRLAWRAMQKNAGAGWNHVSCTPFRGREEEVRSIYPTASTLFLRLFC